MAYDAKILVYRLLSLTIFVTLSLTAQLLQAAELIIAPEPSWVKVSNAKKADAMPLNQVSDGIYYLLFDKQTRVHNNSAEKYQHLAMEVFNQEGIEQAARVSIDFDPTYQTLYLHKVNVIRDGRTLQRLEESKLKLIQRETELEYQIYDGTKTAILILDDVRIGDVIEYSYTRAGSNPVFEGKFFGGFETQWSVPLYQLKLRLLWPENRKLHIKYHNEITEPKIARKAGYQDYQWYKQNIPALLSDEDLPNWYDPYAWIQFSELADWQSVVNWALPLYQPGQQLSPELNDRIANIKNSSYGNLQKVERVLRLVQDEVRYMGIELGANSHKPTSPSKVYERRYGDCKDKSLLMITMLNKMGIKAEPVLVNTRIKRGIKNYHPTPGAFNHVLVKTIVNGKNYWLDPTQLYQTSILDNISQPNYDYALVLAKGNDNLLPMSVDHSRPSRKTIFEEYDLRKGINQEASYKVKTVYEGLSAERMRGRIETTSREEIQKTYLNYYAHFYPNVEVKKNYVVEDNKNENRIEVTEYYSIPEFWVSDEGKDRIEAHFYPPEIGDYVNSPKQKLRTMPMKITFPLDIKVETHIYLPESWSIEQSENIIKDDVFYYRNTVDYENNGKHLTLTYHFKTLRDHLLPENVREYSRKINAIEDDLGYYVYSNLGNKTINDPKSSLAINASEINWPILMLGILLTAIYIVGAVLLYGYKPKAEPGEAEQSIEHLKGIKGWLILPAIGVVLQPIRVLFDFYSTLDAYAVSTWSQLTTSTSDAYHALWAPYLLIALVGNLALMVFAFLLLVMFFSTKRGLPRVFIGFLIFSMVLHTLDLLGAKQIPAAATELSDRDTFQLIKLYIVSAIWITYFSVSKRVKATFVQ